MKRHYVTYTAGWEPSPMGYWIHSPVRENLGEPIISYEKPLPRPVPDKGYPHYHVEVDRFTFEFASLDELDACAELLSREHLHSPYRLTRDSGSGYHRLSKLPGDVKSWRYREKATEYMRRARRDFERGSRIQVDKRGGITTRRGTRPRPEQQVARAQLAEARKRVLERKKRTRN
ncbi:MAG: hypothetical protein M3P51_17865 [Chloroflexota bacterium]|nr:hypothetical protein [Chloroflexota bacterium]